MEVEGDYSSIKVVENTVQLALPITFISNEFTGVLETLEKWKRMYNSQLKGIVIKYSNVHLIARANSVITDKVGFVVYVKAKFHLFCPKVGDILKGKINRSSREHVGCILHDSINATIYLLEFYPDELKKFIRIGQDVLFEITHFDCFRNEIRVKGKITPECLTLMTELYPDIKEEEELTNSSFLTQNTIVTYDEDMNESKDVKFHWDSDVTLNPSTVSTSENPDTHLPSKKSKKRKRDVSLNQDTPPRSKKRKKDQESTTPLNGIENTSQISYCKQEPETKEELVGLTLKTSVETAGTDLLTKTNSKKKKNKKQPETEEDLVGLSFETSVDTESTDLLTKAHSKKKKHKKDKGSKKGKVIATGSSLKADKKKSRKGDKKKPNKDGKKKKSSKLDKKKSSKNSHSSKEGKEKKLKSKKDKKKKLTNGILNGDVS